MQLRDYQQRGVAKIEKILATKRSALLAMAVGTGKTVTFGHLISRYLERNRGSRAIVIAHRGELLTQALDKIQAITGITADIEQADKYAPRHMFKSPIVVASVQTLNSGGRGNGRMTYFDPNEFGLLVVDEAHHATATTYRRVLNHFQHNESLKVIGATATPDRHDEAALGQIFDDAFEYGMLDAIDEGWLVPVDQQYIVVDSLDLSGCRKTAGDLNGGDLAKVLEEEKNEQAIAIPIVENSGDERTLVFGHSIAQATKITQILDRYKPGQARMVIGSTPDEERNDMLAAYRAGEFQYLVNVGVATEGFDVPEISVVAMARPTASRALYEQMTGRGTRPWPNLVDGLTDPADRAAAIANSPKPRLTVLDFVGNSGRHKLISTADILGGEWQDDIVERAVKNARERGQRVDMRKELTEAEKQIREERRAKLRVEDGRRRHVVGTAKYRKRSVDPFDVLDITPRREKPWNAGRKPTDAQRALITKWKLKGVDVDALSFTEASTLIGELIKRRNAGKCSYNQAKLLRRYGYATENMTYKQAHETIDAIAANNWRPIPHPAAASAEEVPF
jgi:superfamily II DNA or RNA helicase